MQITTRRRLFLFHVGIGELCSGPSVIYSYICHQTTTKVDESSLENERARRCVQMPNVQRAVNFVQ